MQQQQYFGANHYPIISVGVDWITATAHSIDGVISFLDIACEVIKTAGDEGFNAESQVRQGFRGVSVPHFFYGRREGEAMIQAGTSLAHHLTGRVAAAAMNISRLDLQVTIDTSRDHLPLSVHAFKTLERLEKTIGRPRGYTLTTTRPAGDTLTLNKRVSDEFGRLYDKGVESKTAPAHSLYRYEVEFKRERAIQRAHQLVKGGLIETDIIGQVWDWWATRGVEPFYPRGGVTEASAWSVDGPERNTLSWFERSVSVTVARAVKRHGLKATIEALGLSSLVRPHSETQEDF
jgi:hypothetical protein